MNIDIITHNAITIARTAKEIWPYILDVGVWKRDLVLRHVRGRVGECGEILSACVPGSDEISFLLENVEIITEKRRTIKLVEPDERLLGFASWHLSEGPSETILAYDVYATYPADPSPDGLPCEIYRREFVEAERTRFQAEFIKLKSILESA